jgi:hypothetical protein
MTEKRSRPSRGKADADVPAKTAGWTYEINFLDSDYEKLCHVARSLAYGLKFLDRPQLSWSQFCSQRGAMTRLIAAVLLVVLKLGVAPPSVPLPAIELLPVPAHAQQDPAPLTVYITRTGDKYHHDGCR